MEEERIIERGTHEQLMRTRGAYHDMVVRQMEATAHNDGALITSQQQSG